MAFILMVIVMTADNASVQHVDSTRFDTLAACESAKSEINKQIYQGYSTNVRLVCVPSGGSGRG